MPATGGEMTRVTDTMGRQDVAVSPDGRHLAIRHSEANHPPELYLQENRPGREMRQVTLSTTEEWRSYEWIKPEIVMITARDGVEVPARVYHPVNPAAVTYWWTDRATHICYHGRDRSCPHYHPDIAGSQYRHF